jgi:hypothetical protein
MSTLLRFAVGQVDIALHGVSREIAEDAVSGLEGELARRLDVLAPRAGMAPRTDLADVALGPMTAPANIDAGALRAMIAEALAAHLLDGASEVRQDGDASPETDESTETP